MTKNRPAKLIVASAAAVALSSVAYGGGMEKTPIPGAKHSPIVAEESACACPWGFTAQVLYLKVDNNNGTFDEQDENAGFRGTISYKCDDNLGYRVRYFEWEGDPWSPELTTFDLEIFDDFKLGNWDGEFSFGLRYASFEEELSVDFDGWGPTLGVELTRNLSGPWALYVNARTSLIFGDNDDADYDSFAPIFELGGGLQYTFNAFGNCDSYLRLGFEAQNWQSIADYGDDAGLFGATAELGMSF